MNYVRQALGISDEKMALAIKLFKEAVAEIANKNYKVEVEDVLIELSAIFGNKWLHSQRHGVSFWHEAMLYTEAKVAFNYANLAIGMRGQFITLAKQLVTDELRVSDERLEIMSNQLEDILTNAKVKNIFQHLAKPTPLHGASCHH